MKKNVKLDNQKNPSTVEIRSLSHDGRGIATIENKTTFLAGALPGETVRYNIHQKRAQLNEGVALEIVTPSPDRATPPCEHFGVCGGCSLQHMSPRVQLELKQQTLLNQLKHFGQVEPQHILPALSATTEGYRRKARLGVKFVIKKDKLLVGFREKSSSYLADLNRCVVLHPAIGERFNELSELIRSLEAYRHIPQIEVAIGDTDVALVFRHLEPLSDEDKNKLIAFGEKFQFHIYLQPNPPQKVEELTRLNTEGWGRNDEWAPAPSLPIEGRHDPRMERSANTGMYVPEIGSDGAGAHSRSASPKPERLTYTLPDEQLEFLFHPLDFTQVNLEMNRLMVRQAINLLDLKPTDKVLDLFCGIGNFTLPIARHAHHVTGIEGGDDMVKRAQANAEHNSISNVAFHAANLFEPNPTTAWMKQHYDKILLDPPRAGAREILPHFQTFGACKIVYVSCNPATLARDAGDLVNLYGYKLVAAGAMNMFPHTAHIEAMAVFEKT